jgi:hypothetical protein
VAFQAPTVSPTLSTVSFVSSAPPATTTPADGTSPFNVFVTLKNTNGQPVAGDVVNIAPTPADTKVDVTKDTPTGSATPGATDSNGLAEFQVRDTVAESVTFTVTDTTPTPAVVIAPSSPLVLTFVSNAVDGSQSAVAANPTAVAADGKTAATVSVTLDDHFGNAVAGKTVSLLQGSGSSKITPATAMTNSSGVATFAVTDTTNEDVTYEAVDQDDGDLLISQTATVAFGTPPPVLPVSSDSVIVADSSSVPADGSSTGTVTVLLYDANGLPVTGRTVALTASGGSSKITPATATTDDNGAATFTVTDTTVENVTYTGTDTSDNIPVSGSVTIDFVAPPAATANSGAPLNKPVVGMAVTPDGGGYWLVAADGGVFRYGDAGFYGSDGGTSLNAPVVGMAVTPDGKGYWLAASDGGVFSFGDAAFHGSAGGLHLNQPIVGIASTPDGGGYWLVASDGGIFAYGDAAFYGSTGDIHLNQPIVGMTDTADGLGYWLVAADGGIFTFGDAGFYGSTGNIHLNQPIVGMAASHDGLGYWLVAADGGVFNGGDAPFEGSTGGIHLNSPIVGMAATPYNGYWLAAADGGVFAGNAPFFGSAA